MIEQTKIQHNHEILNVLEEEQRAEDERNAKFDKVTNENERKRLEKIFGMERAQAQTRIT